MHTKIHMIIKKGDILKSTENTILQQCNCLTVSAHGLSQTLANKWKWSDAYSTRRKVGRRNLAIEADRPDPGTIKKLSSPDKSKSVVCFFAQWAPGKSHAFTSYPNWHIDTNDNREKWFQDCLDALSELKLKEIAIPWGIGCGLAGGNWKTYLKMIEVFEEKSGTICVLYKL